MTKNIPLSWPAASVCVLLLCFLMYGCSVKYAVAQFSDPRGPRYVQSMPSQNKAPGSGIRIVTYNIQLCRNIPKAVDLLREHPSLRSADIICLQEMCHDGVRLIARALGYNYVYYPSYIHPASGKESGNAILSFWPILNDAKIILPYFQQDRYYLKLQQTALRADILVGERKLSVCNVHLGVLIDPFVRDSQMRKVLEHISSAAPYCVIAGDLNTFTQADIRPLKDTLTASSFTHASCTAGWTFKYWYLLNKRSALDHIFVKGLKTLRCGTVRNRTVSDHFPVWAEVSFP